MLLMPPFESQHYFQPAFAFGVVKMLPIVGIMVTASWYFILIN